MPLELKKGGVYMFIFGRSLGRRESLTVPLNPLPNHMQISSNQPHGPHNPSKAVAISPSHVPLKAV